MQFLKNKKYTAAPSSSLELEANNDCTLQIVTQLFTFSFLSPYRINEHFAEFFDGTPFKSIHFV